MIRWPLVLRSTAARWEHRAKVAEKHLRDIDRRFAETSALCYRQQQELKIVREAHAELLIAQTKRG